MTAKPLPSAEFLRATFRYDPKTGRLYWRWREDAPLKWNARHAGHVAGTITGSGITIHMKDIGPLLAHRIIWKMHHGRDPDDVDHIDRNPFNNRIENLRNATRAENLRNRQVRCGISGVRGVTPKGKRWMASIGFNGRKIILGTFDDLATASAAYQRAANDLFGDFAPAQPTADSPRRNRRRKSIVDDRS